MKKVIIWMFIASCLGFLVSCNWLGDESSQPQTEDEEAIVAINLNELLQTNEVLAECMVDKEREEEIKNTIDALDVYLRDNVTAVLENNLHGKKTSVADKSLRDLESQFRNGKVSSFSVETRINERVESYNDKHLYNRLQTVTLNLFPSEKTEIDFYSLYFRLNSNEWDNNQNRIELVNQIESYYGKMLQSDRVIEQMLGIE